MGPIKKTFCLFDTRKLNRKLFWLLPHYISNRKNIRIQELTEGGNNYVYKIFISGKEFILKHYLEHSTSTKKMENEILFMMFLEKAKIKNVPRLIKNDLNSRLLLMSCLNGRKVNKNEMTPNFFKKIGEFISTLNVNTDAVGRNLLNKASDACFSNIDQINSIDIRFKSLEKSQVKENTFLELKDWLYNIWEKEKESMKNFPFEVQPKYISLSDFGFHNIFISNRGTPQFFDFEYSGIDDIAKSLSDFLTHPMTPRISNKDMVNFVHYALAKVPNQGETYQRIMKLLPTSRIRWILIMLNEFNNANKQKKRMLVGSSKMQQIRKEKLKMAKNLMESIYGYD